MPPLIAQIPPWAWIALGTVVGTGLGWLGWRQGPGRQIRALEVEVAVLQMKVRRGWGDDDIKTQSVRGMFGKRTTLDVGKKGPF